MSNHSTTQSVKRSTKRAAKFPVTFLTMSLLNNGPYANDPFYQEVVNNLAAHDPYAIDLLKDDRNTTFDNFKNDIYLDSLRTEMGTYVGDDSDCLRVLEKYLDETSDPDIRAGFQKAIDYLKMDLDTLVQEEDLPIKEFSSTLEKIRNLPENERRKFNLDQLEQCLQVLEATVEPE